MVPARLTVPYRPHVRILALAARHAVDIVPRNTRSGGAVAQVEAHITGTVWKIEVAVGDTVEEGDTVVILESMKMEMPVEAEDEGTVSRILVEEGQSVSEGDPLVELE
jgi:acetyl-CoA carboxylase biotin carboxyl carrier protein